mgnify:CR=1 FL=1
MSQKLQSHIQYQNQQQIFITEGKDQNSQNQQQIFITLGKDQNSHIIKVTSRTRVNYSISSTRGKSQIHTKRREPKPEDNISAVIFTNKRQEQIIEYIHRVGFSKFTCVSNRRVHVKLFPLSVTTSISCPGVINLISEGRSIVYLS